MTSAEWVGAENRPSGCRLTGREISMGKKSAAVALPELLDLIEHCREAPRPHLVTSHQKWVAKRRRRG